MWVVSGEGGGDGGHRGWGGYFCSLRGTSSLYLDSTFHRSSASSFSFLFTTIRFSSRLLTVSLSIRANTTCQDIIADDEMISDVYDLKEVDGVVYEADCSMITIKKGADVDIGANASAEEAAEELEDGTETVNNVVYSFRLNQTSFDKKSYLTYLKGTF